MPRRAAWSDATTGAMTARTGGTIGEARKRRKQSNSGRSGQFLSLNCRKRGSGFGPLPGISAPDQAVARLGLDAEVSRAPFFALADFGAAIEEPSEFSDDLSAALEAAPALFCLASENLSRGHASSCGAQPRAQYHRAQTFPAPHTAHLRACRRTWRFVVRATHTPPTSVLPGPHAKATCVVVASD